MKSLNYKMNEENSENKEQQPELKIERKITDREKEKYILLQINRDDLNCKICNDFMHVPKILQCAHRVCEDCLYKIHSISKNMKCPFCKTVISPDCPTDTFLVNLLENVALERSCKNLIENGKYEKHVQSCITCLKYEYENCKKFDIRNKAKKRSISQLPSRNTTSPMFSSNANAINDVGFQIVSSIFPDLTAGYVNNP